MESKPAPEDYQLFVPSWLDDLGLDAYEFRTYAHIHRRAGRGGYFWESKRSAVKFLDIHRDTYSRCISKLIKLGLVKNTTRKQVRKLIDERVISGKVSSQSEVFHVPVYKPTGTSGVPAEGTRDVPVSSDTGTPDVPALVQICTGTGTNLTHKGNPLKVVPKGSSIIEAKNKKPKTPSKAKPDSIDEAKKYGMEIELPADDVEAWFDHFESNGWVTGNAKASVKDWKATLRTWKRNKKKFETNGKSSKPFINASVLQKEIEECEFELNNLRERGWSTEQHVEVTKVKTRLKELKAVRSKINHA